MHFSTPASRYLTRHNFDPRGVTGRDKPAKSESLYGPHLGAASRATCSVSMFGVTAIPEIRGTQCYPQKFVAVNRCQNPCNDTHGNFEARNPGVFRAI